MIDSESFYNAATELFKNISEIVISSTKYSESSIKILQKLNKKHRKNDLRNLKCLYKLWINPKIQAELKRRFEVNLAASTEVHILQNQSNSPPIDDEDNNRNENNERDVTEDNVGTGQDEETDSKVLDGSSFNPDLTPEENCGTPQDEQNDTHNDDALQKYEERILLLEAHLKTAQSALESTKSENEAELHTKDKLIDRIQKTNANLQAQLDESVKSAGYLQEKVLKREVDYGHLNDKMVVMNEKYEQLLLEKLLLQQNVEALQNTSSVTKSEVYRLAAELQQKQKSYEEHLDKSDSIQLNLKKALHEMSKNLANKTTEWERVKVEMDSVTMQKVERENELFLEQNDLKNKFLAVKKTNEELVQSNIAQRELFDENTTKMKQQLQEAKSKLKCSENKQIDLVNRNVELVQQNEELTSKLLESENSKVEVTQQLLKDRTQFEAFKLSAEAEKIGDDTKLVESYRREIQLTNDVKLLDSKIFQLMTTIEDKQKEIEVIASNFRDAQEYYEEQKSKAATFSESTQSEINSLRHEITDHINTIRSLEEKIEQLTSPVSLSNDLKNKCNHHSEEIKSMNILDTTKNALEDTVKEFTSVSDERSSLLSTKSLLDEKISRVRSQIKELANNFVDRTELVELQEKFENQNAKEVEFKFEEEKKSESLNVCTREFFVRCICGLFHDEGGKIQCSQCMVLQHTACIGTGINAENYLCEVCNKRPVDLEIALDEHSDEGNHYYLTLMRGEMQIRQSDTVYLLRDIPISSNSTEKHTYKSIGKVDYTECDIFRIEQLWKDIDGKRFAYGHHYLRPQETYHEPSRKFYKNEIVRVPSYEEISIDLIVGRCWVLDPITFCTGRPINCEEKDVYICELRVDKSARIFTKMRRKYSVCTKPSAFNTFDHKLKISRDFFPHPHQSTSTVNKKRTHSNNLETSSEGRTGIKKRGRMNQFTTDQ